MNGKKAKQLRKAARLATEGLPDISYSPIGKEPVFHVQRDNMGAVVSTRKVSIGVPRLLSIACTRKYYQDSKSPAQ
jgi:hypothetical protein